MTKPLTPGKLRGLQRASTPGGMFTILAIDHQDALRRVMPESETSDDALTRFKLNVVAVVQSEISGVLLDPVLSATQAISAGLTNRIGLLVELEKADYNLEPMPLTVEIDAAWSVQKTKKMGADGVKLFFYYHPDDTAHAQKQEATIRRIVADCMTADIPLYAEPIIYAHGVEANTQAFVEDFPRAVIESAKRINALDVDILKLEFPVNVRHQPDESAWIDACAELAASIDVPWVLLSAGVDFDTYTRQVKIACETGAAGYMVGRAIWGDATKITDASERLQWLQSEGKRRMHTLAQIAGEYGTPWTEHYHPQDISTSWFRTY